MKIFPTQLKKYSQGFTLVEFIVIMAIFAVMVGVVLFNFTGFRSKITLDNLAQDIAISIRQIQTSAGASISTTDEPQEEVPRGIFFPYNPDLGTYDSKFILFQDSVVENGLYDDGEEIDTIVFQTPDRITDIIYGSDMASLLTPLGPQSLGITFRRFSTGAKFTDTGGGTISNAGIVRIKVTAVDRVTSRYITISRIGQVSVQADNSGTTTTP